ncbi:MAG: hypothetical protein AAFP86_20190, partial [Planctomycetota bacterium]
GLITEDQAAAENAAAQRVAEGLRAVAAAADETRRQADQRQIAAAAQSAEFETQRLEAEALGTVLAREVELLRVDTQELLANVEARRVAGEITDEQARRQEEALRRITELRRADTEEELRRRQALEGDDFFAGFEAQAEQIAQQFSGGALGADAASTLFGTLQQGAEALGQSIAGLGGAYRDFSQEAQKQIVALIVRMLVLQTIQRALGGFGFGGGGSVPGVDGAAGATGGGGGLLSPEPSFFAKG